MASASGGAIAIDLKDGRVIGSSRSDRYNPEESEIEIGWMFFGPLALGGVYNKEMKSLMLGHAFRFVNRVIFSIGPKNIRSQRAMEKIGGVRTGSSTDASGRRVSSIRSAPRQIVFAKADAGIMLALARFLGVHGTRLRHLLMKEKSVTETEIGVAPERFDKIKRSILEFF